MEETSGSVRPECVNKWPNSIISTLLLLLYFIYSPLIVTRWRLSVKSSSQQEIKAIYPSTLQMMYAVLISVICSFMADIFHILLISISSFLYLLSFSVSLVLTSASSGRQVFSFLSCITISGQFASIVRSVITSTSHIIVVPLTFMILSGVWSYFSVTCSPLC